MCALCVCVWCMGSLFCFIDLFVSFSSIPHCLNYYNFIVSLEFGSVTFLKLILLQYFIHYILLHYFGVYPFLDSFRFSILMVKRSTHWNLAWEKFKYIILWKTNMLIILSSYTWTWNTSLYWVLHWTLPYLILNLYILY